MKKNNTAKNIMKLFWTVCLCLLACMCITGSSAKSVWAKTNTSNKKIVKITKVTYDKKYVAKNWRQGMQLTESRIKKIKLKVYGETKGGKQVRLPNSQIKVKQLHKFMYTTKGKYKLTVQYKNLKKSFWVKLNVKPRNVIVIQNRKLLEDEVNLTNVKSNITVLVTYSNGWFEDYKGAKVSVKGNKFTVKVGKIRVSKTLKVIPLKGIEVVKTISSFKKGEKIDLTKVKKATTAKLIYSNGCRKTLNNFSVSASSKYATGKTCIITVKYGKFSKKISVPVKETTKPSTPTPSVSGTPIPTITTEPEKNELIINYVSDEEIVYQEKLTENDIDRMTIPIEELTRPGKKLVGLSLHLGSREEIFRYTDSLNFINDEGKSLQDVISEMIKKGTYEIIHLVAVYEVISTDVPTPTPTDVPSPTPTDVPSPTPTDVPSPTPTDVPSPTPTDVPSPTPTDVPSPTPTDVPSPTPTDVPTPELKKAMINYISNDVIVNQEELTEEDQMTIPMEQLRDLTKQLTGLMVNGVLFEGGYDSTEFINSNGESLQDTIKAMIKEGQESIDVIAVYEAIVTPTPTDIPSPTPTETPKPKKAMVNYFSDGVVIQNEELKSDDEINLPNEDLLNPDKYLKGWEVAGVLYEKDADGNFVNSEGISLQETVMSLINDDQQTIDITAVYKKATLSYISDGTVIQQEEASSKADINLPSEDLLKSAYEKVILKGWGIGDTIYEKNANNEFLNNGTILQDAILALIENGQESIDIHAEYTLCHTAPTINNGALTKYDNGQFIEGKGYTHDTRATINANEPLEGEVFNYWTDGNGNIVSYSRETMIIINEDDLVYTAVYSANPVEMQPIARFGSNRGTPDYDNNTITYEIACNIPKRCQKKEWGLIFTAYDLNEDEFVLGGRVAKSVDDKSNVKDANNAVLTYTAPFNSSAFELHKKVSARVFVTYDENGVEKTIYSDIARVQL